ncbi:hypothetical protein C8J56DRAFT_819218 [Mycena floridula]|nr:hypothetical protein C8J56DRAFT_819218 [Mycena floridula]
MNPPQKSLSWILGFFLLSNIVLVFLNLSNHKNVQTHTFIGSDFPVELPLAGELDYVAMLLQETVRFQLNGTDSIDEWRQLMELPKGRVHLGPEHRVFNLAFWHQLHCIREMARAIVDRESAHSTPGHMMHCLHYMRQTFLCQADGRLEAGDFLMRDLKVQRATDTLVCRDWERVYSYLNLDQF